MFRLTKLTKNCFSKTIVLDYKDLKKGKNLVQLIQKAYGPKGHGILFVQNVPDYVQMRQQTLPLFHKLANLPKQVLKKYQRPDIFYSLGWSCGVQKFQGKYDTAKGSYYVNCTSDQPQPIAEKDLKYFSQEQIKINSHNIWVKQIPKIQTNVKALSKSMISVGTLLAQQIDSYALSLMPTYKKNHLQRIVSTGRAHVGRMLNYFPFQQKGKSQDDWCGWHNDHGSLTGLTSAMYIDQQGKQVKIKGNSGGLYAKNRFSEMQRIVIPSNMIAFQLGQSTQIHTGGALEATPHCVVRNQQLAGKGVSRQTFALFMEPNYMQIMSVPEGVNPQKAQTKQYKIPPLSQRWQNGEYFKDFHKKTIHFYS